LSDGLGDESDAEHWLFALIEQLHPPFCIFLQAARDAADQIGADRRQFTPSRLAAGAFVRLISGARVAPLTDAKKVKRHSRPFRLGHPPRSNWDESRYRCLNPGDRRITAQQRIACRRRKFFRTMYDEVRLVRRAAQLRSALLGRLALGFRRLGLDR